MVRPNMFFLALVDIYLPVYSAWQWLGKWLGTQNGIAASCYRNHQFVTSGWHHSLERKDRRQHSTFRISVTVVCCKHLCLATKLGYFMVFTDGLSGCFKTPCVVFAGHPSLRYGDVVHFMELWGKSSGNTVIFTGTCIHQMILSSLLLLILWVRNIIRRRWRRMIASIWTIIQRCITSSQRDQVRRLIAQLVVHCTGIAEVMGSKPVQAWALFSQLLKLCT